MMSNNINHPVWNVYDSLRTASLNVNYYSKRIVTIGRINRLFEIFIAVSTSTAVGKFTIWGSETGVLLWSTIGGIAVLLTVVKPFMKYPEKIKKIESVLTKYRLLKYNYGVIKIGISEERKYNDEHKKKYHDLLKQERELIAIQPENYISNKLRTKCQEEVNREFPVNNFFIPEE